MISKKIAAQMEKGSWIRKMFEEGSRLKAIHGSENVFDFSIGNPDLEPPQAVHDAIKKLAADPTPGTHAYMSNLGYQQVRSKIAEKLSRDSGLVMQPEGICMTVGAAGALNVALKAILDPDDEVIVLAPYFVEYLAYIGNHGGRPVIVNCSRDTLLPDPEALRQAITPKTKALIINTPNNPAGTVYSEDLLKAINQVLQSQNQTIYVLSDEPYRELAFDGEKVPATLACLDQCLQCYSWSKALSLPGERIGYVAVSPRCDAYEQLLGAIAFCNRTLGFVNAPAFFQRVIADAMDATVEVSRYEKRRDQLADILSRNGFSFQKPKGGFYFFPKAPIEDDAKFAAECAKENLLIVPGSGFGFKGYFRLCFAIPEESIARSEKAFRAITEKYRMLES